MRDLDREDVYFALEKMKLFIQQMPDEEFGRFVSGIPVNTMLIPPRFELFNHETREIKRNFVKMEFRIS